MSPHGSRLLYILLLVQFGLAFSTREECHENEFEDERGNCAPCRQCGPGQELSEECGGGGDPQCVPCRAGRYKEDRGHHRCIRCLPCTLINRVLKANCTLTVNSVCGDCLPGFYSKTRIGGLRELECFPCTSHTPPTETQCNPKPVPGQPVSTVPPPLDPVVLVAVIAVALALISVTLVTLSVICCGRFFKRQCQRAFLRSQDFTAQPGRFARRQDPTCSPCEEKPVPSFSFGPSENCSRLQGPVEEVRTIPDRAPCSARTILQPSVELCALPAASVKPHYTRSVSETQPLIRNSGCSDCFSICPPTSDPGPRVTEPLSVPARSCATEQQHWSHAPVECTELDLQNYSEDGFSGGRKGSEGTHTLSGSTQGTPPAAGTHTCICLDILHAAPAQEEPGSACTPLLHQAGTCEFKDLVSRVSSVTLGRPVSHFPDSLVLSLGLRLNPSVPDMKDFRDVGAVLGVRPHLMDQMQGFEALHTHLSSTSSCTVLGLAQALRKLQRNDALSLICNHFAPSGVRQHWD
ncbi:tumor necrosis factor receptor superfamily member 27 [Ascaphus truei]|uniref:tumor necrosis factor receptor superfamily member 27 n=1 Tax=Ascaphus truei TaxID=8439 RepID=UPI003F5AC208